MAATIVGVITGFAIPVALNVQDARSRLSALETTVAELKQQSQGNYRNYLNTQLTDAGFVAAQSAESVFGAVYRSIQSTDTYAKNLGTVAETVAVRAVEERHKQRAGQGQRHPTAR